MATINVFREIKNYFTCKKLSLVLSEYLKNKFELPKYKTVFCWQKYLKTTNKVRIESQSTQVSVL